MKQDGNKNPLFFLTQRLEFPPVNEANEDGLLAVGGDLSAERLLLAYQNGIFPWFNDDALLLWWSPDPRMVLFPDKIKVSKSMQKVLKNEQFTLTKNNCFEKVVDACAEIARTGEEGTWITPNMKTAYQQLHQQGVAHSYEVWENKKLVGGLYGIDLGHIFCGESMFSTVSNASKFALIEMCKELENKNYRLIDCQVYTKHLDSLGAENISRREFLSHLNAG